MGHKLDTRDTSDKDRSEATESHGQESSTAPCVLTWTVWTA